MKKWWRDRGWFERMRAWGRTQDAAPPEESTVAEPVRIGLAFGGGFARGLAHIGVLRVFERNALPIHCITGVSAGAIAAAAFASGASTDEITRMAGTMRFGDVARWRICRLGFAGSERMERFLRRLLKCYRFEEMPIPFGAVATDIGNGDPVLFHGEGDVFLPIRASCSYPALFQPVPWHGRLLVDGAMSMEVPAALARTLGATRVISVHLPMQAPAALPSNMFQVVNRCFQIMQMRTEEAWRRYSDVVIQPDVSGVEWDGFKSAQALIEAGERAALEALPQIKALVLPPARTPRLAGTALIPDSELA